MTEYKPQWRRRAPLIFPGPDLDRLQMASNSHGIYHNGFSNGRAHSPELASGRTSSAEQQQGNGEAAAATTLRPSILGPEFTAQFSDGAGRQVRSRSSFTLPRSWSSWGLKSTSDLRSKTMGRREDRPPKEGDGDGEGGEEEAESSTSSTKLKRRSSFRNMMDRFRRYKSTESLEERRRRPKQRALPDVEKNNVTVQYVQENVGKIVVPVVGLQNHGNSCYINSVMQCLNNTAQLYEFFISGRYKFDLQRRNRENARKNGTHGELTAACGTLVQSLGRATYSPEISSSLIQIVAKYWKQFDSGGGEQDAQEFWIWLIDKMHEDLIRKGKKKLKIRKSHKADDILAAATEEAYGSSIISRLFHALSRSSLTCAECGQQSNTFEDYTCLPIPLPSTDIRPLFVSVIFSDAQSHIIRYGVTTSVDASVKDIRDLLSGKVFIKPDDLLLVELSTTGFQRTLNDDQDVEAVHDLEDLFAVESLKPADDQEESVRINVVILHVTVEEGKVRRISGPRQIQVSRDITYGGLELNILSNLEGMNGVKPPPFRIHLVERDEYLNAQDDHPLLTESVDQCLSMGQSVSGLKHLKLYVEWDAKHADWVEVKLIKDKHSEHTSVNEVKNTPESADSTTLSDCLDLFMKEETVGMERECPNCGALQNGVTKRGSLWTLPEILVIHLKRFRQTATTRFKLTTMVDFPLSHLDMSRYLTKDSDIDWRSRGKNGFSKKQHWLPWQKVRRHPPESHLNQIHSYSLFGVVNHHGRLNSGHYTSCCRHPADGAWYLYDDLRVKTMESTKDIVTKDAYILFYQREPLNTYPDLYYNDYSKTSIPPSVFDHRTPTPQQSRSADDLRVPQMIAQEEQERRADADFTRTAQLYASLPRAPRRSIVHHPAEPAGQPLSTNGHFPQSSPPAEHVYQRHHQSSNPGPHGPRPGNDANGVSAHPDDWQVPDLSQPLLVRYQQRPIQESCV